MLFRVQTHYPGAGIFLNTNHTSYDLDELKRLVSDDEFRGFRVRIVDDKGNEVFVPSFRERSGTPALSDIAGLLGVPIVDPPWKFSDDEDDEAF
jgi:hypothetical protein